MGSSDLWFFVVLVVLVVLAIGWVTMMLRRNNQIYRYRTDLLARVSVAARRDARAGRPWEWRFEALDAVPYSNMLWHFWRPPDAFFPCKDFLEAKEDRHDC